MNIRQLGLAVSMASLLLCGVAQAKVGESEASRLGRDLTPIGAEKAGNADGSIPAWDGGIKAGEIPHTPGEFYKDPFADDEILFTITKDNVAQYRDKLSTGLIAMFERYPETFKMNVYKTRRTASFPDYVYAAVRNNAVNAELVEGGNGVRNAGTAPPFPIPQNGLEAIWNHLARFIPPYQYISNTSVTPTASGAYEKVSGIIKLIRPYNKEGASTDAEGSRLNYYLAVTQSPPRLAGSVTLVHDWVDAQSNPRLAWTYSTGIRRVRRAPNIAFDNPLGGTDGQGISDQVGMYNGSPERYDWKLVGKQEMYVPYNCYKFSAKETSIDDVVEVGHVNQDLVRYELHRVWIVEANIKEGLSHIFHRRVFYIDEDSWSAVLIDEYDNQKKIWRISHSYPMNFYDVPVLTSLPQTTFDINNGRYTVGGMFNEGTPPDFSQTFPVSDFSPSALRRAGRR